MDEIIIADNLNDLVLKAASEVITNGVEVTSRGKKTKELVNLTVKLTSPSNRHLYLAGRGNNIYATFAEIFWVYSGRGDIKPYLEYFIPRAPEYSDDGEIWRGCFTPDTKISLLNGTEVPIKDLVGLREFHVYSRDSNDKIVPGKAHSARITKYVNELLEITLDNNEIIKCTPDHRFMLRDGSYKEAKDLTITDPLFSRYNYRVQSLKVLNLDASIPVYDISVDEYHNFALSAGVFVHNSYGPRLASGDQIGHVVESLLNDRESRQAVITIWDHNKDTISVTPETKDRPCTQWIGFIIRDNKLYGRCLMRSNDIHFGMSHINIPEWTFLQECIVYWTKSQLGDYRHDIVSAHIYENLWKRTKNILAVPQIKSVNLTKPLIPPKDHTRFRVFNQCLVEILEKILIHQEDCNIRDSFFELQTLFVDEFSLDISNNQYWDYALSVYLYISSKIPNKFNDAFELSKSDVKRFSEDYKLALLHSDFTLDKLREILSN